MKPWIWPGPFQGGPTGASLVHLHSRQEGGWLGSSCPPFPDHTEGRTLLAPCGRNASCAATQATTQAGRERDFSSHALFGWRRVHDRKSTGVPGSCIDPDQQRTRPASRGPPHIFSLEQHGVDGRRSSLRDGRAERVGFSATLPNQAIVPGYPIPGPFWRPGA